MKDSNPDDNCFHLTYEKWFVKLQANTEEVLEIDDPKWKAAYKGGTVPTTALTDNNVPRKQD